VYIVNICYQVQPACQPEPCVHRLSQRLNQTLRHSHASPRPDSSWRNIHQALQFRHISEYHQGLAVTGQHHTGSCKFFFVPWRLFAEIQKKKLTRRTRSRYSMFVSCEKHDLLWRSSDMSTRTYLALYAHHPVLECFGSPSRIVLIHFFSTASCYYSIPRLSLCCRP
jgi:hypothetical protein